MKAYCKTFLLRISMRHGLELEAPVDRTVSRALAFFLRVIAICGLIYVIRWW